MERHAGIQLAAELNPAGSGGSDPFQMQPDLLPVYFDESFLLHVFHFPSHGAAINGEVVGQIHHGKGKGKFLAVLVPCQLQKIADELFADGALGENFYPLAQMATTDMPARGLPW